MMKSHKVIELGLEHLSIRIPTSRKKEIIKLVEEEKYLCISEFVRMAITRLLLEERNRER